MSDGHVQVAPDSTGKKIDNSELAREPLQTGYHAKDTAVTIERQRVVLASDENPRLQAEVRGEPGAGFVMVDAKVLGEINANLVMIREMLELFIGA